MAALSDIRISSSYASDESLSEDNNVHAFHYFDTTDYASLFMIDEEEEYECNDDDCDDDDYDRIRILIEKHYSDLNNYVTSNVLLRKQRR